MKCRLLILEAIERVEISFRAHFANELGIRYGSHFYLDTKYISNHTIHKKLMDSLKTELERSDEVFIEHYLKTYDDPFFPPVWAAAEIMTLGQLSKWFRNIKSRTDRNRVARSFGIDQSILESFMHHLTVVRNVTAHHGRLWNRRLPVTMKLPGNPPELASMLNPETGRYIGNTVIMLGYFLKQISPGTTWPLRMRQLIDDSPGIRPAAMGFHENWKDRPW